MNDATMALLRELEVTAVEMRNITPETGAFLALLVRAMRPRRLLEIGTSNGYSTLWLADAAVEGAAQLVTVDRDASAHDRARANLRRAGFEHLIELRTGDAGHLLRDTPDRTYDFIFLDSDRTRYEGWWPDIERVLAPGGLLVVDNALSHAEEVAPLAELIQTTRGLSSVLVPIGKGELMVHKAGVE